MKLPDIALQTLKDPGLLDFMDYTQILLNNGRYQTRILTEVPTWVADDGEIVCVASGDTRALYMYISDGWYKISWAQGISGQSRTIIWHYPGVLTATTNVSATVYLSADTAPIRAWANVSVAPTGANAVIDVNYNATTVFSTTTKLTITAGSTTAASTDFTADISFNSTYPFTIDIDSVGSTVAGSDLTVGLEVG